MIKENGRIVIAWGTWQLGPMVIRWLLTRNIDPKNISLLVRNQERAENILNILGLPGDKFKFIMGDLGKDSLAELNSRMPQWVNEIINLAGTVKFWEESEHEVRQVNWFGAMTLAILAKERNAEFIHTSTAYILWESDETLEEKHLPLNIKLHPKNPYEKTKANTEKALWLIHGINTERFALIRPSILIDTEKRADIKIAENKEEKVTLPHACMWYFLPFMLLRRKLIQQGIFDWIDLEWFPLCWLAETKINIVDNARAGDIIADLATDNDVQNRVLHLVNKNPPSYSELTSSVLKELKFTWYTIENIPINNQPEGTTQWKKIWELERWPALSKILWGQYRSWTIENYLKYVTHTSRFAWGETFDNHALAVDATQALMPEEWNTMK